ncbi:ferritin [Cesiribacter andamanensis]|uniref:Ferritin n=1 Tax=Cesiribacter andamanensis AMV16 TaxID=1279009 RepID=M7N8S4_9BACT|nr:ferritin [Cesiribacter andamanensis]EMR03662.1 putative ferritin-1 [Cesiribacter andamanensis AMV16]
MKDLLRLRTSLSEEIETALNEQIKREAHSSAIYLAMGSWCDRHGFDNSATFFYKQSDEERSHMLRIFKYVTDLGGHALSPEVTNIQQEYDSFRAVFEQALEQEIAITQSINRIVGKCHQVQDYTTVTFLQWFLKEQIEEEYIARRALELFEVIGEEGVGQYMIDKQIAKLSYDGDVAE